MKKDIISVNNQPNKTSNISSHVLAVHIEELFHLNVYILNGK